MPPKSTNLRRARLPYGLPALHNATVPSRSGSTWWRPGLDPPALDHLRQLARLLRREIARFAPVLLDVVELPAILVESGVRLVPRHRLPAVVPDAAVAEHLEVLAAGILFAVSR